MNENAGKKRLIDNVDPNRRDFVRRIVGGAFASPLVATFSMDALTANSADAQISPNTSTCLPDPGYVGPTVFECHFFDPTRRTRVNGEATFVVATVPVAHPPMQMQTAIQVTPNTTVLSAYIEVGGKTVATLPTNGGNIGPSDITNLCDFHELLQAIAAGIASLSVTVNYAFQTFTLTGRIIQATANTVSLNP